MLNQMIMFFDFVDTHATICVKRTTIGSIQDFVKNFNSIHKNADIIIDNGLYEYVFRLSIIKYSKRHMMIIINLLLELHLCIVMQ